MISALAVANELLRLAWDEGSELTNMALQKLVYITNAYHLAIFDEPLIYNSIKAWQWGPVIPDLYDPLRRWGSGVVNKKISYEGKGLLSKNQKLLVKTVYDSYGHKTGLILATITHCKGSPWDVIWSSGNHFGYIPDSVIRDYYKGLLNKFNYEIGSWKNESKSPNETQE
jgi:uncharacterized phage-associated protein